VARRCQVAAFLQTKFASRIRMTLLWSFRLMNNGGLNVLENVLEGSAAFFSRTNV
jgi:hypothetical protein